MTIPLSDYLRTQIPQGIVEAIESDAVPSYDDEIRYLLDALGCNDITTDDYHGSLGDLRDVLDAETRCSECRGPGSCPWNGQRPRLVQDVVGKRKDGVLTWWTVRYGACDSKVEAEQEQDRAALYEAACIPPKFHSATFGNWTPRPGSESAYGLARSAADQGHSLVLSGKPGNGKTHLAVAILYAQLEKGAPCRFWSVPELLATVKRRMDDKGIPDPLPEAQSVSVLVLDDIRAELSSKWVNAQLFNLINERYSHGLQTIITSNTAGPDELEKSLGEQGTRVVSRLKEMGHWVRNTATDYRDKGKQETLKAA